MSQNRRCRHRDARSTVEVITATAPGLQAFSASEAAGHGGISAFDHTDAYYEKETPMTMGFIRPDSEEHMINHSWGRLLELARLHGWKPVGLLLPYYGEEPPLTSTDCALDAYFLHSGYRMTDADAYALAEALQRALPDIPEHDALEDKTVEHPGVPGVHLMRAGEHLTLFEAFSGTNKQHVKDLIAFFRRGGCAIW